ncbi:uncharacterized protein BROUX77_001688 [Berkeleyomyces rouxiae]|uniref:uncharacterized protein n=1 Tax=Berkeleyomyces rouxiae TaxID=2035830 RepID=UPI003B8126C9
MKRSTFHATISHIFRGPWMLSEDAAIPGMQKPYYPERSHTSEELQGYTWVSKNSNGKGPSGNVYLDMITLDTASRRFAARSQAIQLANSAPGYQNMKGFCGVMGMAFGSRNPIKPEPQPTTFENIMGKLTEKLFTVNMRHLKDGTLEFGHIDKNAYTGDIGYSDVLNGEGYWNFTIGGLTSDKESAERKTEYVIADTASALVMLPMQYNTAYYGQITDALYSDEHGGFVFPCANQVPDFTFEVGGVELTIPGVFMKTSTFDDDPNLCFGGLQSSGDLGFNIIGGIAFKSAFVAFDPINAKIGWAKKTLPEQ